MVKIVIDGIEITCADAQKVIDSLYKIEIKSRCHKCVYENICSKNDIDGKCSSYKRDPPDGGYYG